MIVCMIKLMHFKKNMKDSQRLSSNRRMNIILHSPYPLEDIGQHISVFRRAYKVSWVMTSAGLRLCLDDTQLTGV